MAGPVGQSGAAYRERRAREREEERREERLRQLREQARGEARQRAKAEANRLAALEDARAQASQEQQRKDRRAAALGRARAERKAQRRRQAAQTGRLAAARAAAEVTRRALDAGANATAEREAAARRSHVHKARTRRREEVLADARARQRMEERREVRRGEARSAARAVAKMSASKPARPGSNPAATRDKGAVGTAARTAAARAQRREAVRRSRRAESLSAAQASRRRETTLAGRRAERRGAARADRRVRARVGARAEQRRSAALTALRERSTDGSTSGPGLRVLGPLLLDGDDRPVRLRGIHVPGFGHAQPAADGSYGSPLEERDFDLLASWNATVVSIPLALDRLFDLPGTRDPRLLLPPDLALGPQDPEELGPPSEPYLEAVAAAVDSATERGLHTVLQLSVLRQPGDDRPVPFSALRRFWQVVGERWAGEPTVLYDLMRGPARLEAFLEPRQVHDPVVTRQLRTILLALLGELRSVHPGAIAIAESIGGTVDVHPLTYTDGSLTPGVIAAYRWSGAVQLPPELFPLARQVPVAVLGWGTEEGAPPVDAVGRRLATAGVHWVADAWPATGTVGTGRPLVATAAGRAVGSALHQPDLVVATSPSSGQPVVVSSSLPAPGDVGVSGPSGLAAMVADLVLGAAPVGVPPRPPARLPAVITPRSPVGAYLPTASSLESELRTQDVSGRSARLSGWLGVVRPHWVQAEAAGTVAMLARVRDVERQARAHEPPVPDDLTAADGGPVRPRFLREDLDLNASTGPALGRSILTGSTTLADAARTPHLATQAILGLRRLDDVVGRVAAARACAGQTGADLATVLALYRTEGALAMPPSRASIDDRIPSGTTFAGTFLNPRPDVSQLVWLADADALSTYDDSVLRALITAELVIQVAGLDVVGTTDVGGPSYVRWSYATWKAAGIDDHDGALARGTVLQQAVALRHVGPHPARKSAVIGLVQDPVTFVATALADGVQLLRSLRGPAALLGPAPWPPGVTSTLSPGLAYLRYNIGDDQTKLALASAVLAAASGSRKRWRDLRGRIAAGGTLLGDLTRAESAVGAPRTAAEKAAASARVWVLLQPWCLVAGNLETLARFTEEATVAEWPTWIAPRANVARFRILLDFYTRLTTAA